MGLCSPVVIVENHDSEDHAAGHHHHDAVEVSTWGQARTQTLLSLCLHASLRVGQLFFLIGLLHCCATFLRPILKIKEKLQSNTVRFKNFPYWTLLL